MRKLNMQIVVPSCILFVSHANLTNLRRQEDDNGYGVAAIDHIEPHLRLQSLSQLCNVLCNVAVAIR